jgi:hypothetical protein
MIRNTFLAAVTDVCIFFKFPGSPAERNMHRYCKKVHFQQAACRSILCTEVL